MKASDLENRVRQIISVAKMGQPIEDTLVELKSEWSKDSLKAARRLAAHANAAHGEPIMWIFGVGEKAKTITGVDDLEMANWIQSVGKYFDGLAPALITHVNIHIEEKTVTALYFETSRSAPFVIKNAQDFEVPWREGTRTRPANREDLLSILVPILKTPDVEIRSAELNFVVWRGQHTTSYGKQSEESHAWTIKANLYIEPKRPGRIFIPHKNCHAQFKVSDYSMRAVMPVKFKPIGESLTVRCSATELIVDGPGSVTLESEGILPIPSNGKKNLPQGEAEIMIQMRPSNTNKLINIRRSLKYAERGLLPAILSTGSKWIG